MRWALVWLNLYGCEAVRYKLKNSLKTQKMHFCPFLSLKFIYSEKATKFSKISTNYLSYVLPVKELVEILQNLVAFSEYMNFNVSLAGLFKYSQSFLGEKIYAFDANVRVSGLSQIFNRIKFVLLMLMLHFLMLLSKAVSLIHKIQTTNKVHLRGLTGS